MVALGTGEQVQLAGIVRRAVARIMDAIFIGFVAGVISTVIFGWDGPDGTYVSVWMAFWLLYEGLMVAYKGQTLGKMIMGTRIVLASTGVVPGIARSVARWVLPAALSILPNGLSIVALVVYLSALWNGKRQGWHDMLGKTVVIVSRG